jgi:hypothetical protein
VNIDGFLYLIQGNEHVTRTFPDGREVYTINGIEQGPSGADGADRVIPPLPSYTAVEDMRTPQHDHNSRYLPASTHHGGRK